jgi:hypothetical protein
VVLFVVVMSALNDDDAFDGDVAKNEEDSGDSYVIGRDDRANKRTIVMVVKSEFQRPIQ